jgi:Protein of unknown function (DUF2486)
VADPKHPERVDDPESIPVLTDVIVPGRPPMPHRGEAQAPAAPDKKPTASATPTEPTAPEAARHVAPPTRAEPDARPPTQARMAAEAATEPVERRVAEDTAEADRTAQLSGFPEPEPVPPLEPRRPTAPLESAEPPRSPEAIATPQQAELTERDADHIAERLRARFAGYLREEGRRVIEERCREALDEHATWLIRQVTREVARALEGEVAGWVRDAVRDEFAAHQAAHR